MQYIHSAAAVAFKGWLVADVAEAAQIPDDFMVGPGGGNFGKPHNFTAGNIDRILVLMFAPVLEQRSVKANMSNANAGVARNSIKKLR